MSNRAGQFVGVSSAATSSRPTDPMQIVHGDGTTGTITRIYAQPGHAPITKRVMVPQQSRTITGNYATVPPTYRPVNQPRCTAMSRLESVVDEKPELAPGNRRNATTFQPGESSAKMYRPTDKSRGLRHFSTKVCEKVKEKGRTNYNEVADELVAEYFDSLTAPPQSVEKQQYDMKNIRRRVYDALNVLMAMNIIEKEKKEIRWVGLPTSSLQECRRLEEEKLDRQEAIRKKTEQLQELVIQLVAFKTLVDRNRDQEKVSGRSPDDKIIFLPFIVINTAKETVVDCAIAGDKTEFLFHFDSPFEIHDDIEILKRLGLSFGLEKTKVPPEFREQIKKCLPPALRDYADQIIDGHLTPPAPAPKPAPPQERKINLLRPAASTAGPAIRTIVPSNRYIAPKSAIRPIHRPPVYRAMARQAGQPYAIPPSSVYRTANVSSQYTMIPATLNGRPVVSQRYVPPRSVPVQRQPTYQAAPVNNGTEPMQYEEVVYEDEEYGTYEQQ